MSDSPAADTSEDDDALLRRVRARVLAAVAAEGGAALRTVRRDDGGWEPVGPGLQQKVLWSDAHSWSRLLKLAPGARVAGHGHAAAEECVVLEGRLRMGALVLEAGDYHLAAPGSEHVEAVTDDGATVYLRGPR